jgi:hypothetical protein
MNIVKLKTEDTWKSSAGLCIICGIPLGLEPKNKMMNEGSVSYNQTQDDNDYEYIESENESGLDSSDLEENFIRVNMFKYNLLGKMEECHILDKYTFLKPNHNTQFKKALQDNRIIIEAMGGNLIQDAFKDGAYEKVADYCQRVAGKRVFPGCRMCNTAMNRSNTHADIVYRCFGPTASLHFPELEDNTSKQGKVISKGNVIKKLIQQIALYYSPITDETNIIWKPKEETEIMLQASIWRCVANLCMWGRSGTVRFGLVAIFYGAMYLFERLNVSDLMNFTDWHLHVFRLFYMSNYPNGTWFGMTQQEAGIRFDTTRKDGLKWCKLVTGHYLDSACENLDAYFRDHVSTLKITQFKNIMQMYVYDEKSLFIFLCRKCGARDGIQAIMRYFIYNFDNPRSILLLARAQRFMKEIKGPITKGLLLLLKQHDTPKVIETKEVEEGEEILVAV